MFTPIEGTIGGALIGLSAATLLLCNGEILGASGIISSVLLNPKAIFTDQSQHWKLVFLSAFVLISHLYYVGGFPEENSGVSYTAYAIAGFSVGFGTKLGSGCTSGHGICGLARLSKRSMVSVATFVAVGFVTSTTLSSSFVRENITFLRTKEVTLSPIPYVGLVITILVFALAAVQIFFVKIAPESTVSRRYVFLAAATAGVLFAIGLSLSGMTRASKVFGFLNLIGLADGTYDPTLITVLGAGSIVSFIAYQFVQGHNVVEHSKVLSKPLAGDDVEFSVPSNTVIDWHLIVGAVCFGFGWAVAGLCPGPALVHVAVGSTGALLCWWPLFIVGSFIAQHIKTRSAAKPAVPESEGEKHPGEPIDVELATREICEDSSQDMSMKVST